MNMWHLTITLLALLPFGDGRLTGTWTGSIAQKQNDGTVAERGPAYLQLQEQADRITGSVGPSSDNAHPIEKARFSGDELTFSTHYADPVSNEPVTWSFDLRVNGDAMEGTGTGSRGDHSWTVEVKLARRQMAAQRMQSPKNPGGRERSNLPLLTPALPAACYCRDHLGQRVQVADIDDLAR
jgi:hypothetical protein